MYYNLTEDQKIFLETSYSMLKEGYTHDEIIQFWSSEDEEQVEFVLESLEYVDIDRKDSEFTDLMENLLLKIGQGIVNAGPRAYRAVRTAQKLKTLRRLAQVANPSVKDRRTILRLQRELGDRAKGIKIRYKQTPADELAAAKTRTTGADEVLRTNRSGPDGSATLQGGSARTWERTGPVVQQAQPTPAPAPVKPVKPAKPFKQQVKDLGQNIGRTAQVTTAVGGGVALTTLLQPDGDNTPQPKQPSATQKEVDKDNKMYGDTVPLGSFNVSPQGTDRRNEVEDQIKRDNAARAQEPAPPKETTTDQPTTQQTNTTVPTVVRPKRKRINFGSSSTPGVSRRGVTNSYEYVIGKLIAEGHASSIDEAEYVFEQLDNEYIESMLNE